MNDVWVVSYIDEKSHQTVNVFDNDWYANLCARFLKEKGYANVEVNVAPVYKKLLWDGHDEAIPVQIKKKGVKKNLREYVKIYCCGDCIHYNWKKHCCRLGANVEGKPTDHFYRDCPMGLYEEGVEE